ncbi:MAG: hypothetical protein LC775_03140 [Acidobacteria bacterium]|nr:hypothetical protein [Acidobacteriota bacterium]
MMKPLSSIKAVMGATGVALAFASGSAMAELSKKTVRKIANQEIAKRTPALIGATGPRGPQGPTGAAGPAGPAAVQRYVHVFADGTVDASRSVGVTQANLVLDSPVVPVPFSTCFTGLPLVKGGQVSVDFFEVPSNETAQFGVSSTAGCESFVVVFNADGNAIRGGFFLSLY